METNNIFEALYNYYEHNEKKMPQQGLSSGIPIEFLVVIDKDGNYCRLEENTLVSTDEKGKTKVETKRYDNVPFDVQPTSTSVKAHILYGNRKYFFPNEDGGNTEWNDAFQNEIRRVMNFIKDKSEMQSILRFYENGEFKKALEDAKSNSTIAKVLQDAKKKDKSGKKSFDELLKEATSIRFTFKFHGAENDDKALPIQNEYYRDAFIKCYNEDQENNNVSGYGIDSITGEYGRLVRVFPKLSGSTFVGFNNNSSNSHGYEQMGNCPMSNKTAFKIASAFSYLCKNKKHSFFIGKSNNSEYTLLFWSSSNSEKISDEELESDLLAGLSDFFNPNSKNDSEENTEDSEKQVDGQENEQVENLHKEKVHSVLKGTDRYIEEMNSTYYVASIVRPMKGTVYVESFKSGRIGELYGNLEKYEKNFRLDKDGKYFASPYNVLEACYRRNDKGEKVQNEESSKKHIHMKQELLMSAIFGNPYKEALFAEIIERIYKENRFEYNKTLTGKRVRFASIRAFASQNHELDDFRFERNLENLPYQIGAFYGVCEAIRYHYNLVKNKGKVNENWTIQTAEFRKGLVNQTTPFIIEKLTRDAKVLAGYLDSEKKKRMIGEYKKDQIWHTTKTDDGKIIRKGSWEMTHPVNGELDWAIYRMKKLSDQKKSAWSLDDKAMYLLGFHRMYDSLTYVKKSDKENAEN